MTLDAWVLTLMVRLEPSSPWLATFERSASAIAAASNDSPLFDSFDGPRRTAALLVSLGWFESRLKTDAIGGCAVRRADGSCKSKPHSFCMFQIDSSNFASLGVTLEGIQGSIELCTTTALRILHQSFRMCRSKPIEERLRWYAGGGPSCTPGEDAGIKSKHRWYRGQWLFQHTPFEESS